MASDGGGCLSVAVTVVASSSVYAELLTLTVVVFVFGFKGDKVASAGVRAEDGRAAGVVVPPVVAVSSVAVIDAVAIFSVVS